MLVAGCGGGKEGPTEPPKAAAASRLAFVTVPSTAATQEPLAPAVEVEVQDRFGNRVLDWAGSVTLKLAIDPGSGTLGGTLVQAAKQGVARFDDLTIAIPGSGYTLRAEAPSLPAVVSGPITVKTTLGHLAASFDHTCGLTTAGKAFCWGHGNYGQLGAGSTTDSPIPVAVSGGLRFAALSVGGSGSVHTCGLTAAGKAYCWGYNYAGQLGSGTTTHSPIPVAVTGNVTFASLSVGSYHTCGLTAAGEAYCWGQNDFGQLGSGVGGSSPTPVAVSGGLTFAALSAGGIHTCGLTTGGDSYCWGYNYDGQLGVGTIRQNSPVPVKVTGDISFATLSAGHYHTCGLTAAGEAYCWGLNSYGQLGTGTTTASAIPAAVSGNASFASISAGGEHTCARTTAGKAYCWGHGTSGQLGAGTVTDSPTPVAVSGGLSITALSAGAWHTCGLTATAETHCWGFGVYGRLGTGWAESATSPSLVFGTKH